MCSNMIKRNFVNKWHAEINNRPNTTIETYALYKSQYVTEKFLDLISNPKYRIAVSKLWASSHNLAFERWRHTRPKVNPENRLCPLCYVVYNELHFVVRYRINETLRINLRNKIHAIDSGFVYLDDKDTWCLVVTEIYHHGLGNMCKPKFIWICLDMSKYSNPGTVCDRYTGPCLTAAAWRCPEIFSQWGRGFLLNLRCHWVKELQQRQVVVVRQGPVL